LSVAEARRIVDLCAGDLRAVVCHQLKHGGHWQRVKEIVESGGIGEIRLLHATARPSMLRVGRHLIDAVLWLGGARATSVLGRTGARRTRKTIRVPITWRASSSSRAAPAPSSRSAR
jgi:predicted dehydrogenase